MPRGTSSRRAIFSPRHLGWEPIARPDNAEVAAAWLRITPGRELHLLQLPDFESSDFEWEFGRNFDVEYPVDGFPALKDRLTERGAELIDPISETQFERFFFRDINGYIFEVVDAGRTPEV